MKKIHAFAILLITIHFSYAQDLRKEADSLKQIGLLEPALMKYGELMIKNPTRTTSYYLAQTCALLWTKDMRDTAFHFLKYAIENDHNLAALHDPSFLSLIEDPRWKKIENHQIMMYQRNHPPIKNQKFAKELLRMIIKDQGFMYAGNLEREKYLKNGGVFNTAAIYPVLALEEKNRAENIDKLNDLLDDFGWPSVSEVPEIAIDGATLIVQHADHDMRVKFFPYVSEAFRRGEVDPLLYAKMKDRILIEKGKEQLYGTQIEIINFENKLLPLKNPENVNKRREKIGLGPLQPYLKERFNIDWTLAHYK